MPPIYTLPESERLHTHQKVHSFPESFRPGPQSFPPSALPEYSSGQPWKYPSSLPGIWQFLRISGQKSLFPQPTAYPEPLHMPSLQCHKHAQRSGELPPYIRSACRHRQDSPDGPDEDMVSRHLDRKFLSYAFRSSQRILLSHPSC